MVDEQLREKETIEAIEGKVCFSTDIHTPAVITENNKDRFMVVNFSDYVTFVQSYNDIVNENFNLKLEKSIVQEFPVDYEDVKAVVLEEYNSSEEELHDIITRIKKEHPNLFYKIDLNELF